MPRMTGGEALARQLVREGVKIVFGLPGVQLYGALAALRDERVRFITTRHEQATTYMADGYARAGGGFGTALVVPGPGLLNAAAGLSTAYAASSPVLMLCGQVPKRNIGRDVGVLHEGKGVISDANDLSLGAGLWPKNPLRRWLDAADLVLVVGSRLQLAGFQPNQQVIQVDVDPDEIGRNHGLTFGLVGDARLTLERLLERLRAAAPRPSRKAERDALRAEMAALDTTEPNAPVLKSLRAGQPEDAIVIAGMTQIGYYSRPFWPVFRPRTYLNSSYSGNLGFEYPTALGAKVAHPDRPVVAICGDGGFMYNVQEMSTAVKYGINVVAVVFNDAAYGNVPRDLDEAWGGAWEADFRNPDFMKLADAYGVAGLRVEKPTEVGDAVKKALGLNRPALIEVKVGRMPRPPFFMQLKAPDKYKK